MAITGTGAAAAVIAAMDAAGKFDSVTDETQRAEVRAAVLEGLELHFDAFVQYLIDNVEVTIPSGARVDNLSAVQIGTVAEDQGGTIQ